MMDINNRMMVDAVVVTNNFLYMNNNYSGGCIPECIVRWRQPEIRLHKSAETDWLVSVWIGAVLG